MHRALFSSLPTNATTPSVQDIRLIDVDITIRRTGNITGPPKGKDYSPSTDGFPAIVPAWVSGMTFEGVYSAELLGGKVSFDSEGKEGEQFWSMNCVNNSVKDDNGPTFGSGWICSNESSSAY